MKTLLENFNRYRPLLYELVTRDVKTKYRRSVLGVLWTLLNPLLMMIVLSIVFSQLFKFDVENYPLYLLSGQVIFNFFSESSNAGMNAIIINAPLIKKVYVPKYMFVFSRIISISVNLMASFSALIIVMLFTGSELHYSLVLSVIPIFSLIVFSLGVSLILATYAVKFRDIVHLYTVFTTVLMYLTPVIYPIEILPAWVKIIVLMNPLTSILQMFRDLVMNGTIPSLFTCGMAFIPSIIAILVGLRVFYKNQDKFILYV